MSEGKELIGFDDPKNIAEFLQQPATKLAEFITGILISETKEWKLSAGHLIQASIKWKLFSQLMTSSKVRRRFSVHSGIDMSPA